jgi:hypothetical protein
MRATRSLLVNWEDERTFRVRESVSMSVPGTVWEARMYYGSSRNNPMASCTCPQGRFQRTCRHIEDLINSMYEADWSFCEHHDEMRARFGKR